MDDVCENNHDRDTERVPPNRTVSFLASFLKGAQLSELLMTLFGIAAVPFILIHDILVTFRVTGLIKIVYKRKRTFPMTGSSRRRAR